MARLRGCLVRLHARQTRHGARTYPNIFVAGETYAPVKWDYADLAEVCASLTYGRDRLLVARGDEVGHARTGVHRVAQLE